MSKKVLNLARSGLWVATSIGLAALAAGAAQAAGATTSASASSPANGPVPRAEGAKTEHNSNAGLPSLGSLMENANSNYFKLLSSVKEAKYQELANKWGGNPAIQRTVAKPKAASPANPNLTNAGEQKTPRLWFLSGVADNLEAEVIYSERAVRLSSSALGQKVGPWSLTKMNASGLLLTSDAGVILWLSAPRRGQDPAQTLGLAPPNAFDDKAAFNLPVPAILPNATNPTRPGSVAVATKFP
jgi:hypothetical protein